jgi:hypothetical protein
MMEGIGKDVFEEWMKRLMERIDRLDSIISVLINKEAAGVKYMDGERLYDNPFHEALHPFFEHILTNPFHHPPPFLSSGSYA